MSFQLKSSTKNAHLLSSVISLYMSNDDVIHQNLSFILDTIVNHRLFHETFSDEPNEELAAVYRKWTVRLNALLQSKNSAARWCGITLVRATCENSHHLLVANAKTWSAQLLGFVGKVTEPVAIHQDCIKTLSFLFSYTIDKPELQREVATPNLQRYNQLLLQLGRKQDLLDTVLYALTVNVKTFPATARHISDQCLQLCLSCLDGSRDLDDKTMKEANKCLASLYNASSKSMMAEQWADGVSRLIGSVHECLNRLFDSVDEETQETELPKPYPFLAVSTDYVDAFPVLVKRIQLVQDCICTFLTTSTPIVVGVPVVPLVDLICRIYNVYEGSLMRDYKDKSEFVSLMMCLPSIHLSTSKLLASLLYCSGQEMMRYSKLFSRILLRLLSEHKQKRALKTSVYKLIGLCLQKCGYVFAEIIHKPLIASIVEDLQIIEKKSASFAVANTQQKKSHKKRRTDVTNSDALSSKLVSAASTEVQISALQTLAALLEVFGFAMENGQRASVDSTVLGRLIQIIQPTDMTDEEVILVKAELYQCLISSVTHPIETQASILPHSSRLFSAGINDQSHQLQAICKKGLSICDLIMHSRLPPIQRVLPKSSPATIITAQETVDNDEKYGVKEEQKKLVDENIIMEEQKDTVIEKAVQKVAAVQSANVPIMSVTLPPVVEKATVEISQEITVQETPAPVFKPAILEPVIEKQQTTEIAISTASIAHAPSKEIPSAKADDDMDMDMEMPMIDMAGPDSDDDDE
ncbi:rRNA processing/ribosome biogenesis-domain-containing protein [Parasitella parasitica]|nr:rRNA processing/ribosome biogenesis-domain-containing protein [Parasitella parasitica]